MTDHPRCGWCDETERTGICRKWPHDRKLWSRPGLRAFLMREHFPHGECGDGFVEERGYRYPASYVARIAADGEDVSAFHLPHTLAAE